MKTLLLDRSAWDLVADASRNIAVAGDPYSQAQDAASEIRTFLGEAYYDVEKGVPYWDQSVDASDGILGRAPPLSYMKAKFVEAALTVPGVTAAKAFIRSVSHREVTGQVQITTDRGATVAANF